MSRKELSILITLAAVQFTHVLDSMIMMPMAPSIREAFQVSTQQFGFMVSSYSIAAFVSAVAATFFIDRFDRKRVLVVLYVGFLLGTFACAMAPSYGLFLLARALTGLFGGIAGAVIQSIVGDLVAPERRAQGMGILMTGFSLASVGGIPLGIFLSEEIAWQAPFLFVVALGVLVMAAILWLIPPVNAHLKGGFAGGPSVYRSLFTQRPQQLAVGLAMVAVWAHAAVIPFISDYLVNNLKFDLRSEILWMYVVGGALTVFSSPRLGKLADRVGRFRVLAVVSLLAVAPIWLISNMQTHSMVLLLLGGAMFFVFSAGRFVPMSAMVTSTAAPALRGRFMSLVSAFQQLAMGLSTLIGGLIIENDAQGRLLHFEVVGYVGIALSLLSILVGWGLRERPLPPAAAN